MEPAIPIWLEPMNVLEPSIPGVSDRNFVGEGAVNNYLILLLKGTVPSIYSQWNKLV